MTEVSEINTTQFKTFPGTRYMGSKNKIIGNIWEAIGDLPFDSFYDAFSGSNVVGYFMKCQGKKVITNDFMTMSYVTSKAIIENSKIRLQDKEVKHLLSNKNKNTFVQDTFNGIFFDEKENAFIDKVRANIDLLESNPKKNIALAALSRACMKKRSRGIFTFVGERYNDGRSDMIKSIEDHFLESVQLLNKAVFSNGHTHKSYNKNTQDLEVEADLVYLDPPYYNPVSDNDYTRRYHFIEGLIKNWNGLEIQGHTATKKFESYKTPFSKRESAYEAFDKLIQKHQNSIIVISYSSNSLPSKRELMNMLRKYKEDVIAHEIDYTYSFGNQNHKVGNNSNRVKEYLFIAM